MNLKSEKPDIFGENNVAGDFLISTIYKTQAQIEKKLESMSFDQLKKLLKIYECNIENLTKKVCIGKGLKYKDKK